MSSQWIIFFVLVLVTLLSSEVKSDEPRAEILLKEGNEQLSLILEAINELERERVQENVKASNSDTIKQRPNSKRLRWNRRRILPDPGEPGRSEGRAWAVPTSITVVQSNPDYLNVANYAPTPAPWWFN
ncbi:uncharacterized protein LOC108023324 [Drosophila biarmipes]|uniref:uncharacterized protein LOC108023324 n=1 Tax=Drosophila biarmipes TaxID=125945 RepID=UPI0007E693CE|nr:uncharacterized protein LOC108023324 [Drosophila biarmipes]